MYFASAIKVASDYFSPNLSFNMVSKSDGFETKSQPYYSSV